MKFLRALSLILGLVAPAAAGQYFNTPVTSTVTGTAWQSLAGQFYFAASSANVSSVTVNVPKKSTWTVTIDGTSGTISASTIAASGTMTAGTIATSSSVAFGTSLSASYGLIAGYSGGLLSGTDQVAYGFLNAPQNKGVNLGYDTGSVLGTITSQSSNSGLSFWTHNGSWGERMRLHTNGFLGIGTTSPLYSFHNATDSYLQGQAIVGGTMTVLSSQFSVGGSTFNIANALVVIGTDVVSGTAIANNLLSITGSGTNAGGHGAVGILLRDITFPYDSGAEANIYFAEKDSGGTDRKTTSISSKFAGNNTAGTAVGVLRLNATNAGGVADNVDFRMWGGNGIKLFSVSDDIAAAPGANVFSVPGQVLVSTLVVTSSAAFGTTQSVNYGIVAQSGGSLLSGTDQVSYGFFNGTASKGLNFGYDTGSVLGTITSQSSNSGISFWTHNGSWGERLRIDTSGNTNVVSGALQVGGNTVPTLASNNVWTGTNKFTGLTQETTSFFIVLAQNQNYTTTQTSFNASASVTGSTGSFVVNGTTVTCSAKLSMSNSGLNNRTFVGFGVDGNVNTIPGTTAAHGVSDHDEAVANDDFNVATGEWEMQVTAGQSHSFYLNIAVNGGTTTLGAGGANSSVNYFKCYESPHR